MAELIDANRDAYEVEPICAVLPIAPSTYHEHKARQVDPPRRPGRVVRAAWLKGEIRRVWDKHFRVYGPRKVWRQLQREGIEVARCTVERLMRELGLQARWHRRRPRWPTTRPPPTPADSARPTPVRRRRTWPPRPLPASGLAARGPVDQIPNKDENFIGVSVLSANRVVRVRT